MTRYDVALAGYGPVGALLANLLGRDGFRVCVLEQGAAPYNKPRAVGLDHEAIRVLQSIGLADAFMRNTRPYPGGVYLGIDGHPIKRFDPLPPPHPLGWPPNVTFVQPELEALLRDGAARYPSVDVRLSCRVTGFEAGVDDVRVFAEDEAGKRFSINARYLIACDGAGSGVRTQLGIALEDEGFDEWWVVVDMLLQAPTPLPPISTQYCWPSRPATYIFGPGNLRRWELKILPGERPEAFHNPARVLEAMRPYVDTSKLELWRSAVYRFHALVAAEWRRGPVVLAGDAAHQTPPFLGQGLCAGFRDAANLAWKLRLIERCGASPALLDTYMAERKPHVQVLIQKAKEFGLEIGELDPEAAKQRDHRLRDQLRRFGPVIRQTMIPSLRGGVLDPGPIPEAAGRLFVQPQVRDARGCECLLDDAVGTGFLLITRDIDSQRWLTAEDEALWRPLGGDRVVVAERLAGAPPGGVTVVQENGRLLADWMAALGARAVIVRPDRYVYGAAASAAELRALVGSLRRHLFSTAMEDQQ